MTDSMVERVARAIDQGVCAVCGRPAVGQITPQDCDRKRPCEWRPGTRSENARAAIEAMREPTEAMLSIARRNNHPRDEETWRTMIDAALKD